MSAAAELTALLRNWWGARCAAELEREHLRRTLEAQWQNVTDRGTTAALFGAGVDATYAGRIRLSGPWELRLSKLFGDVSLDVVWTDAPPPPARGAAGGAVSDDVAAFQDFVAGQILSARVGCQLAVDAERHALEVLRNHEDLVSLQVITVATPPDGAWVALDLVSGAVRPTAVIAVPLCEGPR